MNDQQWQELKEMMNDQSIVDQELFSDDDSSDLDDQLSYLLIPQAY
jgi:hypothetical protein